MCSMMNIKLEKKKQTTKFDREFVMICNLREILNNNTLFHFIYVSSNAYTTVMAYKFFTKDSEL